MGFVDVPGLDSVPLTHGMTFRHEVPMAARSKEEEPEELLAGCQPGGQSACQVAVGRRRSHHCFRRLVAATDNAPFAMHRTADRRRRAGLASRLPEKASVRDRQIVEITPRAAFREVIAVAAFTAGADEQGSIAVDVVEGGWLRR